MQQRFIVFAFLIALACLSSCRHEQEATDRLLVYIMAGQSNMAGRGLISPEDTVTDPRIFTIDAQMNMVTAREPLHFYQPGFEGLDCGMSFAKSLLERAPAGTRICLVPAAVGSSSVEEWLGDSLRVVHLFSNAVKRAQIAVAKGGEMAGVLWHQGETNAESLDRAKAYDKELDSIVFNFRAAFGRPALPFFAGTLPAFCQRPLKDSVNAAIARLAQHETGFVLVNAADLSGKADSVHFDARAQRELGRRFAIAAAAFL